jgi:enoyl-CoA hydratase
MTYENIKLEAGPVSVITIDRPKVLNALDRKTMAELTLAVREIYAVARVVIVTGGGEKAFVAGADIASMAGMTAQEAWAFAGEGHALGEALEGAPFVTIAAVNGFALGGGCELALACDFIHASEKAKFGQPEVKLGVIPGFGGTQRLARRVGVGLARELCATGDVISAAEALRIGLVNSVVAPEELLPKVRAIAERICKNGPLAVAAAKRAIRLGEGMDLASANAVERELFGALFATEDQKEGMRAFLEKREASFSNK